MGTKRGGEIMTFETDWLERQVKMAKEEYDKWPEWKKEAMQINKEESFEEKEETCHLVCD